MRGTRPEVAVRSIEQRATRKVVARVAKVERAYLPLPLPYYAADGVTVTTVETILRIDTLRSRVQKMSNIHGRPASVRPPVTIIYAIA